MKFLPTVLGAALLSGASASAPHNRAQMMKRKTDYWNGLKAKGELPKKVQSARNQAQVCTDGFVTVNGEDFPCSGIDFEGFLSLEDSFIDAHEGTTQAADIWGWLSPEGREITLWCVDNGLWFVDTTEPADMKQLGFMVAGRGRTNWCDVKVYQDTAYIVKDVSDFVGSGIQVFDLNRLVGLEPDATRQFEPDFDYTEAGHEDSHNVVVNTDTGFLYSVGTDTCRAGLHMVDLSNPLEPAFAGCAETDGYTHDAQCVIYDGPDSRFVGNEICFAYNEDSVTIYDVTDKAAPIVLSRKGYDTFSYTHQGWVTDDMKYLIMNDELDEANGRVGTTTTYFINIKSLTNPVFETVYAHPEESIDHNLYVWGSIHKRGWGGNPAMENPPSLSYAYLSNYLAGIKVLDISQLPEVTEVGMFDVSPEITAAEFAGTWSNYMHPSGVLAVSSIERGLFTLRPQMAFAEDPTSPPGTLPPAGGDGEISTITMAAFVLVVASVLLVVVLLAIYMKQRKTVTTSTQAEVAGALVYA